MIELTDSARKELDSFFTGKKKDPIRVSFGVRRKFATFAPRLIDDISQYKVN